MSDFKIIKREVRYAVHIERTDFNEDTHYVKEQVTYSDGTTTVRKPKISLITNYERPIHVTKEQYRDHVEKKEFEYLEKLNVRMCTDSDLNMTAANMLGNNYLANVPNQLKQSQFLYGYDVTAANLIKLASLERNDNIQTPYSIATFDLETVPDTTDILISSIAMVRDGKDHIFSCINAKWLSHIHNPEKRIREKFLEFYPERAKDAIVEMHFYNDDLDIIENTFKKANEWAPDFLSVWNINFDLNQIILPALRKRGKSPVDYICDQRLPRELRRFRYVEGQDTFTTSSGVIKRLKPAERWHKIFATCTFQFIDGMCVYRALRMHKAKEQSYGLDAILRKEIKSQKLSFKATDHLSGVTWHLTMQKDYPIEYCVYNFGDDLEPLRLDEKTGDLRTSLPIFAEIADFNDFGSSNKKNYCSLYVYGLTKGQVIGVGCDMKSANKKLFEQGHEQFGKSPLDVDGWIQTIPQGNFINNGLSPFADYDCLITNTRGNVVDMDSVSSYPSCTMAANVSKATCVSEVIRMQGLDQQETKEVFLGLIVGNTNVVEICSRIANLPTLEEISEMIDDGII